MTDLEKLKRRARQRARAAEKRRQDPRFAAVLGRLCALGLIETNIEGLQPHRRKLRIEDACWVGDVEPRVHELLPALVLKKPGLFRDPSAMPDDLGKVIDAIRHGRPVPAFRGIPGAELERWIPRIGHRGKQPTVVKTFRLDPDDLALLDELQAEFGFRHQVDVIRAALRALRVHSVSTA